MKKILKILVCAALLTLICALTCSCEQLDGIIDIIINKPPSGHVCSYDQVTVISDLFCDRDGIITRACDCGRVQTEITSAYGHSFGEWETVNEPSCNRQGSEQRVCLTCQKTEERPIDTTYHDYTVTEVIEDGETKNRYYCNRCGESFDLRSDIALPEYSGRPIYLFDREGDFSFKIICPEPEDYIRKHLRITGVYSGGPESQVDYTLTDEGDGIWTISPAIPYPGGASFAVRRSGGVVLLDFGLCDLIFSIKTDETKEIIPTGEVIYLAALEAENPGYYPYNLDFSDRSGDYFLALEKADGLSVGDLICVGNAKSFDELLTMPSDNTFGRIRSLSQLSDGRTLAVLSVPDISELISELKIYSSIVEGFYDTFPERELEEDIKNMLYSDPDFADLLSYTYSSAQEYLSLRGLESGYADFAEFLEAIITEKAEYSEPEITIDGGRTIVSADCGVDLIAKIPVMLGKEEIGQLQLRVTVYVHINALGASLRLENGKFSSGEGDGLEFSLNFSEDISAGYTVDLSGIADYAHDAKLFAIDISTGLYHLNGCENIKDKITVGAVTVYEFYNLLSKGEEIYSCEDCSPVQLLTDSMLIIDSESGNFHRASCEDALLISKENLIFSERSTSLTEDGEHTACTKCQSESPISNAFTDGVIKLIELGEDGEYAYVVGESLTSIVPGMAVVGRYVMTFSGIDRQAITLSVGLDFTLCAASHYSYEMRRVAVYGFIATERGPISYGDVLSTVHTQNGEEITDESKPTVSAETLVKAYVGGFIDTVSREIVIISE